MCAGCEHFTVRELLRVAVVEGSNVDGKVTAIGTTRNIGDVSGLYCTLISNSYRTARQMRVDLLVRRAASVYEAAGQFLELRDWQSVANCWSGMAALTSPCRP